MRQLRRTSLDRHAPEILYTAIVGDEVERAAIRTPHRPLAFCTEWRELLVAWRRRAIAGHQPQLTLVQMAAALSPPLRLRHTTGDDRRRRPVGRRRSHELRGIAVSGDDHWRAAVSAHAVFVGRADVMRARREVDPFSIRRPRVE